MRYLAALLALFCPVLAQAAPPLTVSPGALTICSAINRPPMEFFSAAQQPAGVDIELGKALAAQLQLRPVFVNLDFTGLVPALLAGHCDIILAQLFINPARLKVIDEIPYMQSRAGLLVRMDGPAASSPLALAGKIVVTVAGTTSAQQLALANQALQAGHAPLIRILPMPGNIPALQALRSGQADAYAVAYETGLYYARLRPGNFALAGAPYYKSLSGIGVAKTSPELEAALKTALAQLRRNGAYAQSFADWGLDADMLPP
jgi:polar amino acid transport system substrate-binding protein